MSQIKFLNLYRSNNILIFNFSISDDLKKYISNTSIRFEYDVSLDSVPDEILMIVFVANFLPYAWCFDSEIIVPRIDKDFMDCIPRLEETYRQHVYLNWTGKAKITADQIIDATNFPREKTALFFSGGVDAMQSLMEHLTEKPDLISVWGADIAYENVSGWKRAFANIQSTAKICGVHPTVIRTNARCIENDHRLNHYVYPRLNEGWWEGIKYAIFLFGLVAPLAYLKGYRCIYLSSSYSPESEKIIKGVVTTPHNASTPWTDDCIRFCKTTIAHNGYQYNRHEKIAYIIQAYKRLGTTIPLRVCWRTITGENCCRCEKCLHAILTLIVEGVNPVDYGFENYEKYFTYRRVIPVLRKKLYRVLKANNRQLRWILMRNLILERKDVLLRSKHTDIFQWIIDHDFQNIEDMMPPWRRLFSNLSKRFHLLRGH